jgi:hypothetical protein
MADDRDGFTLPVNAAQLNAAQGIPGREAALASEVFAPACSSAFLGSVSSVFSTPSIARIATRIHSRECSFSVLGPPVIDVPNTNKGSRKSFVDWIGERRYGNYASIFLPKRLLVAQPTGPKVSPLNLG